MEKVIISSRRVNDNEAHESHKFLVKHGLTMEEVKEYS